MPSITKEQVFAISRGVCFFNSSLWDNKPHPVRWPGIKPKDLLNPNGIDLTDSNISNPVYPYIPRIPDQRILTFTIVRNSNELIYNGATNNFDPIYKVGGDLDDTEETDYVDTDYHQTGVRLLKKLK